MENIVFTVDVLQKKLHSTMKDMSNIKGNDPYFKRDFIEMKNGTAP